MNEPETMGSRINRQWRRFLLDARFQLKFASYIVAVTLVVASMFGAFLFHTTRSLFAQAQFAVDARSKAAEMSKELGTCTLNNDLAKNLENPEFEKQLSERSEAIDRAYRAEAEAVRAARTDLIHQQQTTLAGLIGGIIAFVVFIGLASIVTTHRIVGPLFRIKRMAHEVAHGKLRPPSYGLRPSDELKDVFDAFSQMISSLRATQEGDLKKLDEGKIDELRESIKERL